MHIVLVLICHFTCHKFRLPVDVHVGKMLIFGAIFRCLDSILTIAAFLSTSKSPFEETNFNNKMQARAAHKTFLHPNSDYIIFLNVWEAYRKAGVSSRLFCRDKFLNYSVFLEIIDARIHYFDLLCSLGFVEWTNIYETNSKQSFDEESLRRSVYCLNSGIDEVVHTVICAGLYPNVARLSDFGSGKEACVQQKSNFFTIARTSVNAKVQSREATSEWMIFFEKFGTERLITVSTTAFISPLWLMLCGSDFKVLHTKRHVIVDGWIELSLSAKAGVLLQHIRYLLESFVTSIITKSQTSETDNLLSKTNAVVERIISLVVDNRKLDNGILSDK